MTYTKDNLRQIFQQPFNAKEWQQMLRHYFQATELRAEPERIDCTTADEQGYYLGAIDTTDSYRIGLFYYQIQHGNVARKRVGLRNLVKSFINPNWGTFDAALVVFDSGSVWRLSFVCDIKGENTAAKRYTYVFGEGESFYNTPVGRFEALQRNGISFENIKDAFSVEALSKEFFDEYREHYADIVEYITGKRYVKEKGKWVEKTIHEPCHEIFDQFVAVYKDPEKTVRDYIKKLMGRLVFLQFLQKKEWMGVPADRQDWKGGDTRFLQNKFNEFADKNNFIDGFLEPLFNDLNTNRQDNNDLASPKVGSYIKIPFLNGGLFQLDEEDCSNIRLPQHLLGDVLDFFERYNFTIDENDPNDAQIGVDPEMLGRVFENLLEDNKDKGAFYTPKEIVQYMCQESLIAYLQTGIDDECKKESIRQFVLTHESEHLGAMAEDISIKLLNVKICDPAIGSGAFPMGLLRQLYLCQCAIHPELEEKNAADIKRHIIQNNIYGVDIEKGAVDIARLRFWLSLIVDEETPRFLPNLDFKIMQGNSLLEQYKGVDLSKMTTLTTEQGEGTQLSWFDKELDILRFDLREKLYEYYNCSNHQRKEQLKQEIIENVKQQLREQSIKVDFGDLDLSANEQFTLWHTWFYDVFSQGGFDIVIGNPPYVLLQNSAISKNMQKIYLSYYKAAQYKVDLYHLFMECSCSLCSKKGVIALITPITFLMNEHNDKLRVILHSQTSILCIVRFHIPLFENASVDNAIFFGQKGLISNHPIKVLDIVSSIKEIVCPSYKMHSQDSILPPKYFFEFENAGNEFHDGIIKKMEKHSCLSTYASTYFGIQTYDRKLYVSGKKDTSDFVPTVDGVNVKHYYLSPNKEYVDFRPEAIKSGGNPLVYKKERILVRQIGEYPDGCICPSGVYTMNTIYNIYMKNSIVDIRYLLGIINSKAIHYFWKARFSDSKKTFPKIKKRPLESLPIAVGNIEAQNRVEELVNCIVHTKRENPCVDTSSLEQQIDLLVYHLYGLTYDEILIVDPETPITQEEYENS